ncbi:hypothetical protein Lalb_Chr18g0048681 [Lupinus albus]|uniref:Uncharacterized protein n=1 Tax=Lupinus albus TaxID=3870 RepID=A0A6A4P1E5_LUPAL|nr:hypothetical protein Lalb_Chr18g0048681 [Lupinus albus]
MGSEEDESSRGTPTKGLGLKKWKRIRRNVVKDPNSSDDSGKMLKRGLPGNANSSENQLDVKEKCESLIGNVEFSNGYVIRDSSSDSRYAVGSCFVVETDSENNEEERSGKSSMAASRPMLRSEISHSKNASSKNLGNSGNGFNRVRDGLKAVRNMEEVEE